MGECSRGRAGKPTAAYYVSERAKGDKGWHRRDASTFLNNFSCELDRALAHQAQEQSNNCRHRYENLTVRQQPPQLRAVPALLHDGFR